MWGNTKFDSELSQLAQSSKPTVWWAIPIFWVYMFFVVPPLCGAIVYWLNSQDECTLGSVLDQFDATSKIPQDLRLSVLSIPTISPDLRVSFAALQPNTIANARRWALQAHVERQHMVCLKRK